MISQNAVINLAVLKYAPKEFTILLLFFQLFWYFDFRKRIRKWNEEQNGADSVIQRTKRM